MLVVPNQLYSFHYSQVPGLERIYELSRDHSYAPESFNEREFLDLPADHKLFARRATLDHLPDEETILQKERELAQAKGDHSVDRPLQNVESEEHRRTLESLPAASSTDPPTRQLRRSAVPFRKASGYVKLDERKTRLAELIGEVSQFFDARCHCQGDYWYPQGGFRDWHTNKYDASGWRLYIVDVDAAEKSYFRIKHPSSGEVITLWDRPGTFNFFLIDPNRLLWHCIGAPQTNRWSKGFVIPDTWLDRVAEKVAAP